MQKIIPFFLFCAAVSGLLSAVEIPHRDKVNSTIDVLPQVEMHYGTFQNFLHYWKDRPLYLDRSQRYEGTRYERMRPGSIMYDVRNARRYQISGLSALVHYQGADWFKLWLDTWEKNNVHDLKLMLSLYVPNQYAGTMSHSDQPDYLRSCIRNAVGSPCAYRINGKVVVNSYEATRWSPEQWKKELAQLRKTLGDRFLFIADMKIPGYRLYAKYESRGELTPSDREQYLKIMQSYLDVCDGLYFYAIGKKHDYEGEYGSRFDKDFFEREWRPLLWKIMTDPRNRGKIFGAVCQLGYVNRWSGMVNCGEYGTETLRQNLEAVLSLNPDFIVPFEWNELNENTCFMPTLYKGSSTERIMRRYQALIEKRPPTPRGGDDLTLPNLIFSYRYQLKYGEPLRMELLSVPDGSPDFSGQAVIRLRTPEGTLVEQLTPMTFRHGKFQAQTVVLPTEKYLRHQVLVPEIELSDRNGKTRRFDNLLHIRLLASDNTIYQYVRHAIRDTPAIRGTLRAERCGKAWRLIGSAESEEELMSTELLNNRDEIRAAEDRPEYDMNRELVIVLTVTGRPPKYLSGTIRIENAGPVKSRSAAIDCNHELYRYEVLPDGLRFRKTPFGANERQLLFAFDKARAADAVIVGDLSYGKFRIPVKNLLETDGIHSVSLEPLVLLKFERQDTLPDIPSRLSGKRVAFDTTVTSRERFPVFSMRLITKSGKVWYSTPVLPEKITGEPTKMNLYSETARKRISVMLPVGRIPDLNYLFTPDSGSALRAPGWYDFAGTLGGGYSYCQSFRRPETLPKNARSGNPQWIREGDAWLLRFDGIANNITFPREALPRGAFTMEMEIRPADDVSRVLFRSYGGSPGSFCLLTENGSLTAGFLDSRLKNHVFRTGLKLRPGEWNTLRVHYDLQRIELSLNGKSASFPLDKRGRIYAESAFGGPAKPVYGLPRGNFEMFRGDLRKLRIFHR